MVKTGESLNREPLNRGSNKRKKTFDTNYTNYHEFLNGTSNSCQFVKFVSKVFFRPLQPFNLSRSLTFPKCEKFHNLFLLGIPCGVKHGWRAEWILFFCGSPGQ